MTKVFIIMGNDYPRGVFDSKAAAEAEVARLKELEQKCSPLGRLLPMIYWKYDEFDLNKPIARR